MELVYWSDHSSSRREGYGVKGVDGGIVILASNTLAENMKIWCNFQEMKKRMIYNALFDIEESHIKMQQSLVFKSRRDTKST